MTRKSFIAILLSAIAGLFLRRIGDVEKGYFTFVDSEDGDDMKGVASTDSERARAHPFKTIGAAMRAIPTNRPQWASVIGAPSRISLLLLCLAFTGCTTTVFSPATGKPLLRIPADATQLAYSGAGVTFTVARLSHSTVARANWKGGRDMASVLGSDVVAVLVPGSGTAPLVGKAAIATLPHLAPPKSPTPDPASIWPTSP